MVLKLTKTRKPFLRRRGGIIRPSTSFISPGDATGITTDRTIFEFLKLGSVGELETSIALGSHHGADTHETNNENWIKAIKPKYIVFSAGNKHHHPRCSIVRNYLRHRTPTASTTVGHDFSCFRKVDGEERINFFPTKILRTIRKDDYERRVWKGIDQQLFNTTDVGTITFTVTEREDEPEVTITYTGDINPLLVFEDKSKNYVTVYNDDEAQEFKDLFQSGSPSRTQAIIDYIHTKLLDVSAPKRREIMRKLHPKPVKICLYAATMSYAGEDPVIDRDTKVKRHCESLSSSEQHVNFYVPAEMLPDIPASPSRQ